LILKPIDTLRPNAGLGVRPTSVRVSADGACGYSSGRGQDSEPGEQHRLCDTKLVLGENAVLVYVSQLAERSVRVGSAEPGLDLRS
jgi:hypothetical protein